MFTIDKEVLEELYNGKRLTTVEIGKMYNVSWSTVLRKLKQYGINTRAKGNIKGKEYKYTPHNKIVLTDEEIEKCKDLFELNIPVNDIAKELNISRKAIIRYSKDCRWERTKSMLSRDQYDDTKDCEIVKMYKNGASTTEIGDKLGVTHRTVINHLKHAGVERRTLSQSQFNYNHKEIPEILEDYDKLYDSYVLQRLSKKELAEQMGVSPNVIDRKLKEYGIKVRGCSEAFKGICAGSKHPNWKGGITDLYRHVRSFSYKDLVRDVYKRDGYKCQLCGSSEKLQAHHIRPFRDIFYEIISEHAQLDIIRDKEELFEIITHDGRILDENNLITYCADCHRYKIHGYKRSE